MVGTKSAYQYSYNTVFDDTGAGPNYVAATVEHVEHNPISLNQPHTTRAGLEKLRTVMTEITLFENKAIVSYNPNPTDDEDEDDDVESDSSDSGESNAEKDVPPHEAPLVPEFGLVDASDDEATSHGALPEHPLFGRNEELRKGMVFGSKEQVQHVMK